MSSRTVNSLLDPGVHGVASSIMSRLEWQLRHPTETALTGDYRSAFRGRGIEFDQVVKYQWGDDLRDIDWNVTARLGEPYRKQFVEERDVCVVLLFEDAPELQFGSAGRTRRETLIEAALGLMSIAVRQRDRVGLLYTSPTNSWFRSPKADRESVLHTASMLVEQPAPLLDGPAEVESPWPLVLRAAARRSVLVWLGPFSNATEPDDWDAVARRYQVIGFRADDPWDRELPAAGTLPIFDPVTGGVTEFDPASPANRAAHTDWAAARDARFAALFPDERTRHVVPTDAPVFDSLADFFQRHAARHVRTG
jgi:uncharacterized protein (DUF58 family)